MSKLINDNEIGTTVQAYDADLSSWASVTRAAGFDTFTATPSSANLASLVSDETGTGALVFANSPTLTTPALGTPASGDLSNCTFPTLNQNTTGSAATLTTARTFRTNLASTSTASFNGSANVTPGVTGTLPVANGGTGRATATTAYGLIAAGTTATGAQQTISPGTSGQVLTSNGASALPTFQAAGGAWSVLADVNISGSAAASLASGTITSKATLKVIIYVPGSQDELLGLTFNSDTGSNYGRWISRDNGTASSANAQALMLLENATSTGGRYFVMDIFNYATDTKSAVASGHRYSGSTAPVTYKVHGAWNNTSDAITSIQLKMSNGTSTMNVGTRMIVLGAN